MKSYKLIELIVFLLMLGLLLFFFDVKAYFNVESITQKAEFFKSLGFIGVLIIWALYALVAFLYLPINILSVPAGIIYGSFFGGVIAYVGAIINMFLSFLIARFFLKDFFCDIRKKKESFDKVANNLEKNSHWYIFYARLFFLTPYNILNIICGISTISAKKYMLASACGATLQAFFYSYVGSTTGGLLANGQYMKQGLQISAVLIAFFAFLHIGKKIIEKKFSNNIK